MKTSASTLSPKMVSMLCSWLYLAEMVVLFYAFRQFLISESMLMDIINALEQATDAPESKITYIQV